MEKSNAGKLIPRRLLEREALWLQALPGPTGAIHNPFRRGKLSGYDTLPDSVDTAQKYTFFIAPEKRVDIFVKDHSLAYLELADLTRNVGTGVKSRGWMTAPLSCLDRWHEKWLGNDSLTVERWHEKWLGNDA
eukprot:Skav222670  [mRNA]  locus=scaffold997:631349:632997:- [translate_table: standard]